MTVYSAQDVNKVNIESISKTITIFEKSKQRDFYRSYKAGALIKITDKGWKSIYEYELEKGYITPDNIPAHEIEKYKI